MEKLTRIRFNVSAAKWSALVEWGRIRTPSPVHELLGDKFFPSLDFPVARSKNKPLRCAPLLHAFGTKFGKWLDKFTEVPCGNRCCVSISLVGEPYCVNLKFGILFGWRISCRIFGTKNILLQSISTTTTHHWTNISNTWRCLQTRLYVGNGCLHSGLYWDRLIVSPILVLFLLIYLIRRDLIEILITLRRVKLWF